MKILFFILISIPFILLIVLLLNQYRKMVKNRDEALKNRKKHKDSN